MEEKYLLKDFLLDFVDLSTDDKEAIASIANNELFNFVKFILTDDKGNANKQRIPKEEFANLIKTGIYTPFKMAVGKINEGHDEAFPIGVITNLTETDDQVRGIAALWNRERPEDVKLIKEAYANKKQLNVSWELLYSDSKIDEDGYEDLYGTTLRAVTLVGLPAYQGRTSVFAVASANKDQEDIQLEELDQLKEQVSTLEAELQSAKDQLQVFKDLETELISLREYKASIDAETQKAEKLQAIKAKFTEAGLEKDDEYFETNQTILLGLEDTALDFIIQDMKVFTEKLSQASTKTSNGLPNFVADGSDDLSDPKKIAALLRKRHEKK